MPSDRETTRAEPAPLPADTPLLGRHAAVTGGARGIGAAIAAELARLGATITVMGRDLPALERTAEDLRERFGVEATGTKCDVSDEESVGRAFEAAAARNGAVQILVNNAGQAEGSSAAEISLELWNRMLAVNLTGSFLCARQVLPAMVEARSGRIVNIASTAGLRGYSRMAAYCASKHGVVGLTRALAVEAAKSGVTVNAVCPGYTNTDMAARAVRNIVERLGVTDVEAQAMLTRGMPRGTLVEAEEVAAVVGWLALPSSGAITGEAIVLGGEL